MPPFTHLTNGFVCALVLVLGIVAIVLMPVEQALANGPHVRAQEVFSGPAGAYQLRVLTVPLVGTMHLSTYVAQRGRVVGAFVEQNVPVSDVTLQISGTEPQGASTAVGPVQATAVFGNPGWYGVSLPIAEAGAWTFTLVVEGPLGEAQVEFPVNVQRTGGIPWALIGMVAPLLAIFTWWALFWRQRKGRPPEPHRRGQKKR